MIDHAVSKLVTYALRTGLIEECETTWAINTVLDVLKLDSYTDPGEEWGDISLSEVLDELMDDAHARGVLTENSVASEYLTLPHIFFAFDALGKIKIHSVVDQRKAYILS